MLFPFSKCHFLENAVLLGAGFLVCNIGDLLVKKRGSFAMITFDYGRGEGGKKCQNIDYVICERPLTAYHTNDLVDEY